jgi:phospho-N-acetylmuramoyl-pentapeptide-transferase
MLYQFLYPLHESFPILNVFRYITFRTVYAVLTAFVVSILIGRKVTALLAQYQVRQAIRDDGPKSHLAKAGTPTMGGILILGATLTTTLLWADLKNRYVWMVILVTVGFGLVGFWDDALKCRYANSKGLRPRAKFGFQVLIALAVAVALYATPAYSSILSVPFFKTVMPDLGLFYIPFAVLVIVGASNAVNLTDGLDGLAMGPVIITTMAYAAMAYLAGHHRLSEYLLIPYVEGAGELSVFCGALIGASLGFLWFNAYPATLFMGDVGSLPLGAAIGTVAVISKHELLLAFVGGIFVVEAVSVMLQVFSFKLRGKRIFKMAPIHHHFELSGWKEPKIVVRFWIVSIMLALLSLSTLKLR